MKTRTIIIILIAILLSFQMAAQVSASTVEIDATSDGGTIEFICTGDHHNFDVDVSGFHNSNVDIENEWSTVFSRVRYESVESGTIYLRATDVFSGDSMYYYRWDKMPIQGNGVYVPPGGGGRYVNVIDAPNTTGFIEYPVEDRKAVFLFDTRHKNADVKVVVHNDKYLENATVILINGNQKVKWTDQFGEAEFKLSTGTYSMIVEHSDHNPVYAAEMFFESSHTYTIIVNMTEGEDMIVYGEEKSLPQDSITPQGYVNYFADRLREYIGSEENCADGTLERMATQWGIYPDPPLNVVLYSYNFTKLECINDLRIWEITSTVKNYQQYSCTYTVKLIAGNTTTEIDSGTLPPTWSLGAKTTDISTVALESCDKDIDMYLMVMSKRVDD